MAPKGSCSRSCHNCNRKKVKCDKQEPCGSCVRTRVRCSFPPSGPRVRRSKRTIIAEMSSRISSLEAALARTTAERTVVHRDSDTSDYIATDATRAAQLTDIPQPDGTDAKCRSDVVIQSGSSKQYFDEVLLSRVLGEEGNVRHALTTPQESLLSSSPFDARGILASPDVTQLPSSFHPSRAAAVRLWNIYLSNVHGCTGLKILHTPTDEVKVYSTIDDPSAASFENLALCFAVYFAAAVSLDYQHAQSLFAQNSQASLFDFKVGMEQSFAHGEFLDHPTLTGLLALAIYLAALRVHNHGKGIWVLNGLAIRMAQSIGLHSDGESLGLSPFESEIRRRLWWHLLSRDGRAGEDYGLTITNSQLTASDVSLPLNVDDAELHPEMGTVPTAKTCWTAMTFSLINIDLVRAMQELSAIIRSSSHSYPPTEARRSQIITKVSTQIDSRLPHCNPVIPQHRLSLLCSRFLLRKLDFISRQQFLCLQNPGPREDFATEEFLIEALEILEPRLDDEDDLLMQFAWARKAYPQYHIAMYVLWHLCVRSEGPSVARAWNAMERFFSEERGVGARDGFAVKSRVLLALRAKAVSRRPNAGCQASSPNDGAGGRGVDLVAGVNRSDPIYLLGSMRSDELNFDISNDDWPNWATLAEGFQLDGQACQGVYRW